MTDSSVVLLSVRSPYVERLLDGLKTVELRRRWLVPDGSTVLLYAAGNRRELVGSFTAAATEVGTPATIWRRVGRAASVSREEFDRYFDGAPRAVAIHVEAVRCLQEPVALAELRRRLPSFRAPQSYRYLQQDEVNGLLNGERQLLVPSLRGSASRLDANR